MNPPVVLSALLNSIRAAGFRPVYRPFYPRLTRRDLKEAALVVLLSGNTPSYPGAAMSERAVKLLAEYVKDGGMLVLAPSSGDPKGAAADHERYLFNLLLYTLGVNIRIRDDWIMDRKSGYRAALYNPAFAEAKNGGLLKSPIPDGRMITERTCSLDTGAGARPLLVTYPSAHPRRSPSDTKSYILACWSPSGRGLVVVIGRYLLSWGGGNSKEPAQPILPMDKEEEGLTSFIRSLFKGLYAASASTTGAPAQPSGGTMPAPPRPPFPLNREPIPGEPPSSVSQVATWMPPQPWTPARLYPLDARNFPGGIRAGWAYINREPDEISKMIKKMDRSGMNALWGVAMPHLITSPRVSQDEKGVLLAKWEHVSRVISRTSVKWFVGMEFPGRLDEFEAFTRAVGAQGRHWPVPSPWDSSVWEERVIRPARIVAQWALSHPGVAGIILDLEMYGRLPLYYGNGVDFGNGPYGAFLRRLPSDLRKSGWNVIHKRRFSWLRDMGLLEAYYEFLQRRAQSFGTKLHRAIRAVHPRLLLGTYSAGILQRWFYRGLWKGMSEQGRPVVLFTFQRDAELDLASLGAQGIPAVHVRGILLGMVKRGEYSRIIGETLINNDGYWLNRITSLVADSGYEPIEAPRDMSKEEAWDAIREANLKIRGVSQGPP